MLSKKEIEEVLKHQLALDYNCDKEDFSRTENIITVSKVIPGRREYIEGKFFITMVTMGGYAVIMADERLHPFLKEYVQDKKGFWLFEQNHYFNIQAELDKYGKKLRPTHHMFLPNPELLNLKPSFETKWFEQEDIMGLYGNPAFPNALCKEFNPKRPDVLAVAAMDGQKIVGLAGCSADSPKMWQIGIDIHPDYRKRGIGAALVGLLKDEVFKRNAVPFYGTSLSNLGSWKIALKCGFYPAWVETETK